MAFNSGFKWLKLASSRYTERVQYDYTLGRAWSADGSAMFASERNRPKNGCSVTVDLVHCVSTFGWRLITRPSLSNKTTQRHCCNRHDTNSVKVEWNFQRRSPPFACWQQQRHNCFCDVRYREQLLALYGSFRYHLTTYCILCQVQVICYLRFVHRELRPKTVQLTCSVFPK
jgi:hypothetical protein